MNPMTKTGRTVTGVQATARCMGLGMNIKKGRLTAILPHFTTELINAAGLCTSCQAVQNAARLTDANGVLVVDRVRQECYRICKGRGEKKFTERGTFRRNRYIELGGSEKNADLIIAEATKRYKAQSGTDVKERKTQPDQSTDKPDIWAAWDPFKKKYPTSKSEVTPRSNPLPGTQRKEREEITPESQRSFPHHVVQAEADKLGRVDPVTEYSEGTVLQLKDTNRFWEVKLMGDHRIPWNGKNTTPGNLQIMSSIANNYKLDSNMSLTNVRDRIAEAGWHVATIPYEHVQVLRLYGKVRA